MRHMLFALIAVAGMAFAPPAFAQDEAPAEPEVTEETVETEEEAATAADATEEPEEGAVEGDEAAEEGGEPDEAADAPEGEDGAEQATDPAEEIEEFDKAVEEAFSLIDAIQSKNWPLAVGLILMLFVFVANKLGLKNLVGPKAVPWVAMAIAVCGTVGTGLVAGLGWAESIIQGVLTGVAAIGGWELLLKHILGDKKPDAEVAADAA